MLRKLIAGLIVLAGVMPVSSAQGAALGLAFTYQGRLDDGGGPADGSYDLEFTLYDAVIDGDQVGITVTMEDVVVAGGLFTTELDFGGAAFDGTALWLQLGVRPGASIDAFTRLDPRQSVTAGPFALYARNAATLGGNLASAFATALHNHFGQTWNQSASKGLSIVNSSTSLGAVAVFGSAESSGYGVNGTSGATTGATASFLGAAGVWGDSSTGKGVIGSSNQVGVFGFGGGTVGFVAGVEGLANASTGPGTGVYGRTNSPDGVGVLAAGSGTSGTALQISNGAIKVSGAGERTNTPVFIHVVNTNPAVGVGNTCGQVTSINNAYTNGHPNAILIVTHISMEGFSGLPLSLDTAYSVFYMTSGYPNNCLANRWVISPDSPVAIPDGTRFNVLVVTP